MTAWILVTVPLLVAGLVWFVVRMPHLLQFMAKSAVAQGNQVVTAWRLVTCVTPRAVALLRRRPGLAACTWPSSFVGFVWFD